MRVFVDPQAFYAALVRTEPQHPAAGATLRALLTDGAQLCTTSYALHDLMRRLQEHVGLHAVLEFERTYRPFLSVVWIKEEDHRATYARLRRRWERSLSLAQASLLSSMEESGVTGLFSFDPQLAEEGARLIRTPDEWRAYALAVEAAR